MSENRDATHLAPDAGVLSSMADHLALAALARVRVLQLVLTGGSVIDLRRLWFVRVADVDQFLRLSGYDTDNPLDIAQLWELQSAAVAYLQESLGYRLPDQVVRPPTVHDLFLLASGEAAEMRRAACMVLKVMHIFRHLEGRELVFNTPISEAQLFDRLNARVVTVIDRMRGSGVAVSEFTAGKKRRASLVSKLLAKRSNLASQIFDKVRFRLILDSREDLVNALIYLAEHLFPFNYVVPGQSTNGIITAEDIGRSLQIPCETVEAIWDSSTSSRDSLVSHPTPVNEFSGPTYRAVNFVADIPMRIDDVAPAVAPAVAFVQTEIQLVDIATARANDEGDNAHRLYKERQMGNVRARLEGIDRAS